MPEKRPQAAPQDLYIYYLKGNLPPRNETFDKSFIANWQEEGHTFLFFSQPAEHQIENLLKSSPDLTFLDKYHMTYDQWHGDKTGSRIVGSFLIMPPWESFLKHSDPPVDKLRILLDPGVVFGTGTHPTTRDCLEALEFVFKRKKIESLIDLGTGTGLLALAAARLGCKKILAVDLNYLAVKTANGNICLNRMENEVLAVQGNAKNFIDISADLVIANIHYDVMQRLISSKGFLSKKWFILSGLLRSQAKDVTEKLSRNRAQLVKQWDHNGIWFTFLGQNRFDSNQEI